MWGDEPDELDALAVQRAEPGAARDLDDVQFVRGRADLETVIACSPRRPTRASTGCTHCPMLTLQSRRSKWRRWPAGPWPARVRCVCR